MRLLFGLLMSLTLLACVPQSDSNPVMVTATPNTLATAVHHQNPTPRNVSQTVTNTPSDAPTPNATEIAQACMVLVDANPRPQYAVDATLNWATRTMQVTQTIEYTNTTSTTLDVLVFQVEANRQEGFFLLESVTDAAGNALENIDLSSTRLTVPLSEPLNRNCVQPLQMTYTLRIPPVLDGYFGRFGYLGFTERQMNLGHWMPMVAIYTDEWSVPQTYFVGEQMISEISDFQLNLVLEDAPAGIDIAAPGSVQRVAQNEWRYTFEGGRDFTLSLGLGIKRTSELAPNGKVVEVFYFPTSSPYNAAGQALTAAVDAMLLYEELFAVPYPYDRLVVVEGDFPDGMEFSGIVFVGEAWFRNWRGEPNSWLTVITVHEVSHQWWYTLVGNNPAEYPYMDEAFATYSEYLYFQRYYGELNDWWWDFRVRTYDTSTGAVDNRIYDYENARLYINEVYLRGAQMLHNIRGELGDEAFFAWLQTYLATHQQQIVTPSDLWSVMPPNDYERLFPLRQQYFRTIDVLPPALEAPVETTPAG